MPPSESALVWGCLSDMGPEIDPTRTVIVTDARIRKLHGSDFPPCPVIEVERGEAAKSLAGLEALWSAFLDAGVGRSWTVLAIGGGSVSDLAGLAASTWLRGIDFGIVPTTLLSMVDAAVGGKNGIDFRGLKNLVGTFSKPRFVRFDPSLLDSLPDGDFASGMAEVIKHGLLEGGRHFDFLESSCRSRGGMSPEVIGQVVRLSVEYKAGVAGRDPREAGERRLLNLGHTIGHGVEAVTGLAHGACVAVGLASALRLAARYPGAKPEAASRVLSLLSAWSLPTSLGEAAAQALARAPGSPAAKACAEGPAFKEAVIAAMASDKKRVANEVLFALPLDLGRVEIVPLALEKLCAFIREAP